jgi:hypothetical protein
MPIGACQLVQDDGWITSKAVFRQAEILSLYTVKLDDYYYVDPLTLRCKEYRRFDLPPLDAFIYRDTKSSLVSIQARTESRMALAGPFGYYCKVYGALPKRRRYLLVVPMLGAAPLCALVSLLPLKKSISLRADCSIAAAVVSSSQYDMSVAVLQQYRYMRTRLRNSDPTRPWHTHHRHEMQSHLSHPSNYNYHGF